MRLFRARTRRAARFLAAFAAGIMVTEASARDVLVSLPTRGADPVALHLGALPAPADPSDLLQVFVGASDPCCADRTPIAGRYAVDGATLTFSPAFGFEPGQDYVARATARPDKATLVPFRIALEAPLADAAVTKVFPSGDVLPENTLRFYIHFSTPMKPHVAFDHIRLRDASGRPDDAAFMRFKQELWNADRTRLTVLIDPGRIKRTVATNVELGPALREGQRYTLEIAAGWPSADGGSTLPRYTKSFTVGAPLRSLPSLAHWTATRPCVGTRQPLSVSLDRPFDHHLLERSLRVEDGLGRPIEGALAIGHHERAVTFTPASNWADGRVQIVVDPSLEDVAANNFRDLLDHVGNDIRHHGDTVLPIALHRDCG